jgi:hypothetical protein
MTIQDWFGLTLTALSILTVVGVAVRWIVRHYIADIVKELKPNGGSSLKDQVNRLEKEINDANIKRKEMSNKIDHLYDLFIDYLASNNKSSESKNSKNS